MPRLLAPALFIAAVIFFPTIILAHTDGSDKTGLNVIDICWRRDLDWRHHRMRLARCSVGYSGKMLNNIGRNVTRYIVTDNSDDPNNVKPGTLRYGATKLQGKVWISFRRDMTIKLKKPLLVKSFTALDGRGAKVHIAGGFCIILMNVTDVIIHGLNIHNCKADDRVQVKGPGGEVQSLVHGDGDAIMVIGSSKIWIDHNTLYDSEDGLIDVTLGSTNVTISNNWFKNHDMVMLLGHDDACKQDKNIKVTVAFNIFGPDCNQRMPRVRQGFAHVVNNLYQGWGLYAIGGSMNPSVKSQANLFIADNDGQKEIVRKIHGKKASGNFHSVNDLFENGAVFSQTGEPETRIHPDYDNSQKFPVADATRVRILTKSSGALNCQKGKIC